MSGDTLREVLYGLAPTAGVVLIFYVVIRSILRSDESERRAAREFGEPPPADGRRNGDGTRPDGDGQQP